MADDLLDGLRHWLDKSGRALELRVARVFRRARAQVLQSFSYQDPTTGTQREGDVLASFWWTGPESTPCALVAVVEAKSATKHPWVAFYDGASTPIGDLNTWFYFAHGRFNGITEPLVELWIGQEPLDVFEVATHVVAAHTNDTGLNPASDAVRQVLSAAEARRLRYVQRDQHDKPQGLVIMPVIVTAAPLVTCRLNPDGEVVLEQVDYLHVWGYDYAGQRRRVYVLAEPHLPRFAAALSELARAANTSGA